MWLVKCQKSLASQHCATVNILNSLKNCTTALSSYCFITLAKIVLGNVRLSLSDTLRVFVNTLTADNKYSLRNSKNLLQPIQLQLTKKLRIFFFNFLLHIGNLHQGLNILKEKR